MASISPCPAGPRSVSDGTKPFRAWVRHAACTGCPHLFEDPRRVADALGVCARCPVLADCRQWSLHHAVAGVAGGLTAAVRRRWRAENRIPEPAVSVEDFLSIEVNRHDCAGRALRAEPILAAVGQWTRDGESARMIGARLGCSSRQVVRLRAVIRRRLDGPG